MKAVVSRLLSVIGCAFIFAAARFCLWSISLHLVERADLAVLLFPFGLRLGLMPAMPPRLLASAAGNRVAAYLLAGAGGGAGAPDNFDDRKPADCCRLISRYRQQRLADAAASGWGVNGRRAAAIAAVAGGGDEGLNALLLTLTGGSTLAPTCRFSGTILPAPSGGRWGRRWWRSRLTGAGGI